MPILEIKKTSAGPAVIKVCQLCKQIDTIAVSSLKQGTDFGIDMIALPACSKCGAQETLNRTMDKIDESKASHRRAVNALSEHLIDSGLISETYVTEIKKQRADGLKPEQVGEFIGIVARPSVTATAAPTPMQLAQDALKAAQAAVAAAQAAQVKK